MAAAVVHEGSSLSLVNLSSDLVPLLLKHLATPSFHFVALVRLSKASRTLRAWVLTYGPLEYRLMHHLSCSSRLLPCLPSLNLLSPTPVPPPAPSADDNRLARLEASYCNLWHQDIYMRVMAHLAGIKIALQRYPVLHNEAVQSATVLNNMASLTSNEDDFKKGAEQIASRSQILLANGNQHMLRSGNERIRRHNHSESESGSDSSSCSSGYYDLQYIHYLYFATSDPQTAKDCAITVGNWYRVNNNRHLYESLRKVLCLLAAEACGSSMEPLPTTWTEEHHEGIAASFGTWCEVLTGALEMPQPEPAELLDEAPILYEPAAFAEFPPATDASRFRQLFIERMLRNDSDLNIDAGHVGEPTAHLDRLLHLVIMDIQECGG
ncbi:hypothetical protein HDU88_005527 [Geranomyces variabilis]|nr:hypothetical protein HDU88_005527 [Geranomyces variabilis]